MPHIVISGKSDDQKTKRTGLTVFPFEVMWIENSGLLEGPKIFKRFIEGFGNHGDGVGAELVLWFLITLLIV